MGSGNLLGHGEFSDRDKFPLPDLILLDLKMPVIDGHEVLRQIKQSPVLKRIPVVVLSSSKEEGDRAMTYDNGANSYLVKPLDFFDLEALIRDVACYWLRHNERSPATRS